jgi:uncharacterized protein (TIGR00288 family)
MGVIKHKEQRVGMFIDAQNLYHSAKNLYHGKVNFGNVVKDAVAGRSVVRVVAYVITTESGEEKTFFEALEKLGIETKTKDLQIFWGGAKKADWDVSIAIDAIRIAHKVDAVVLVSGDGDFVPLAQHLKQMGVQVEVACFEKSVSARLKEEADIFLDLSQDLDYFLINNRQFKKSVRRLAAKNNFSKSIQTTKPEAKEIKENLERVAPEALSPETSRVAQTVSGRSTPQTTKTPTTNQNPVKPKPDLIPLSDKNYTVARKLR